MYLVPQFSKFVDKTAWGRYKICIYFTFPRLHLWDYTEYVVVCYCWTDCQSEHNIKSGNDFENISTHERHFEFVHKLTQKTLNT